VKKQKTYLRLTAALSVLFGIILPLVLGVKDPILFAVTFSSIWLLYVAILLIHTFLISGRKNLKKHLEELLNDR